MRVAFDVFQGLHTRNTTQTVSGYGTIVYERDSLCQSTRDLRHRQHVTLVKWVESEFRYISTCRTAVDYPWETHLLRRIHHPETESP